jgi:hypothetical protein
VVQPDVVPRSSQMNRKISPEMAAAVRKLVDLVGIEGLADHLGVTVSTARSWSWISPGLWVTEALLKLAQSLDGASPASQEPQPSSRSSEPRLHLALRNYDLTLWFLRQMI